MASRPGGLLMHQNDFEGFAKLLKRLTVVYGKKLDDELTQAYWIALKDQTLDRLTAMAEHRMKHSKFFPKPMELRPVEDRIPPSADGKFEEGEERSMRNLEELRQMDPEAWVEQMKTLRPGCRALEYAYEHGVTNIWFDIPNRCWKHVE
jgi:hypothetical protein